MIKRRPWIGVLAAATVLALVSLASNVTTESQLSGEADTILAVRSTLSRLLNAGVVWGGLAVLAGRLVRRPLPAVAAGVLSGLAALAVHYAAGTLTGMFDADIWRYNAHWFVAAAVTGGPLGLVGAITHREDRWGLAARLVIPAGAVLEPFVLGWFTAPTLLPWPTRVAGYIAGAVLVAAGALGGLRALSRRRTGSRVGSPG
ncbi:hypothetical protein [Actinoplanes sp. G11-F43]|uniref:hypothetical protein n=1 Tax=Actinoplanes sp. G11-F43 TaxID=3424130 RepID=UPI003D3259E6